MLFFCDDLFQALPMDTDTDGPLDDIEIPALDKLITL